jgi:hypothetical protein
MTGESAIQKLSAGRGIFDWLQRDPERTKLSDLNMLLLTGGCERTEAEYCAVFRDAGFELTRTVPTKSPTGTTVIEGRPG